jgi:hypothetical protein
MALDWSVLLKPRPWPITYFGIEAVSLNNCFSFFKNISSDIIESLILIPYTTDYSLGSTERYSLTIQKINIYTIKMTLAILNLREEDAGLYRCQAGKSEATIRLYSKIFDK